MSALVEAKRQEWRRNAALATLQVIARDGVEAASMRGIAQELGCTTGALTHYFTGKADLIKAALDLVLVMVEERSEPLRRPDVTQADLERVLLDIVRGDTLNQSVWKAWLAIVSASMSDESLLRGHARQYRDLRHTMQDCLSRLRDRGVLPGVIDPATDAIHLLAFVDGLGVQAMIDPRALGAARRAELVRGYVQRLAHPLSD